jgi:protein TonB
MVQSATLAGRPLVYRGVQLLRTSDRATAITAVVALHAAVVGGFAIAQLSAPAPPPETTLSVSFITEETAAAAPSPPQPQTPTPPTPEPRLMATAAQTPSPMSAPPLGRETVQQQQTPAPPAPAAPASAPSSAPAEAAVTPPNFTAAYLNNPGPVYPMASRRKREQGVVRLRVQVGPDGAPLQVLLERTSNHPDLDAAALDVVKKRWRFAPAKQGDRTVAAWVIVPMQFSLDR